MWGLPGARGPRGKSSRAFGGPVSRRPKTESARVHLQRDQVGAEEVAVRADQHEEVGQGPKNYYDYDVGTRIDVAI